MREFLLLLDLEENSLCADNLKKISTTRFDG